MNALFAVLLMSLLGLWPMVADVVEPSRTDEQSPGQRRLLNQDQIQLVQERLRAEGFNAGPVNRVLNAQTGAAIRQYQQNQGIPVSGALDEATMRELQFPAPPGRGGER
jgi:peptidoglycan hydrolase-like protein with peptidoglycan-binding domain